MFQDLQELKTLRIPTYDSFPTEIMVFLAEVPKLKDLYTGWSEIPPEVERIFEVGSGDLPPAAAKKLAKRRGRLILKDNY